MKLAVVGPTYPFRGGISHYTSLLVHHLRVRNSIDFFSFSRQYPQWLYPGNGDRYPSISLQTHEMPSEVFDALNPISWRRVASKIANSDARLAILPWSTVYWAPFYRVFLASLKHSNGPRTLFICHNVVEHESSTLKNFISKRTLTRADSFIVHSHWDKANLLRWLESSVPDRIHVSAHPVYTHLSENSPTKKEACNLLGIDASHVLLFFGFVREYKGLSYLLQSLPLIPRELGIHLVIAGEVWDNPNTYTNLIAKLGLSSSVTFIQGYVPNEQVSRYFAACDLVVAPYVSATQSGIVQLAFGFQKPVIVGRVGGLTEVVEEGKTGYLVPPRDSRSIAEAVVDFYTKQRGPAMREAIVRRNSENSWDLLCQTIEGVARLN